MPEDRRAEVQQPLQGSAEAADAAAAEAQPVRMPAGTPLAANAALATAAAAAVRQDAAERRRASTEAQHAQQAETAAAPISLSGNARSEGPYQHAAADRDAAASREGAEPAGGTPGAGESNAAEGPDGSDDVGNDAEQDPYVHIPDDERRQLANDFLELMQVCSAELVCDLPAGLLVLRMFDDTMLRPADSDLHILQAKFLGGEDADVDYAKIDADATLDDDFSGVARQDAEDRYFAE